MHICKFLGDFLLARKPMADVFVMVCRMQLRKKRGAPTHAFAFPIRKRMFLPEHIRQGGCWREMADGIRLRCGDLSGKSGMTGPLRYSGRNWRYFLSAKLGGCFDAGAMDKDKPQKRAGVVAANMRQK